jgi:hypothetical protein
MMAIQKKSVPQADPDSTPSTTGSHHPIDREAPAGTENSLGAESVRDGRPSTQDNVVEAKDEMPPSTPS